MDAAFLNRGRRFLESRMGADHLASTVTVRRKTGRTAQDENTGRESAVWETTYTGLPCRISASTRGTSRSSTDRAVEGGIETEVSDRIANLPAATSNVRDGDLIEITAGENTGLVFRIVEADWQDQATARRLPVVAEKRPEEWT